MKKLALILFMISCFKLGLSQSCLPEGIEITTQEQIDNFQSQYPGCNSIEGFLIITGSEVTNLTGLSPITGVGSEMKLENCTNLFTLSGLEGIQSIGGDLSIINCNRLNNLDELIGLTSIGGYLFIMENDELMNIDGLENIDKNSINNLYLTDNYSLTNCSISNICSYISDPNGSINIYGNNYGCEDPRSVAQACGISLTCLPYGNYYFFDQASIDNFATDYPGCIDLGGNLVIDGNQIYNLNGLNLIHSVEKELAIQYCDSLESLAGLEELVIIGERLLIVFSNSVNSIAALESLDSLGGLFLNHVPDLRSLEGLERIQKMNQNLTVNKCSSLNDLSGLDSLTSAGGVSILRNDSLEDFTGLGNLSSIGNLIISNNNMLIGFAGMNNLELVDGGIYIKDNPVLQSLSGLDEIDAGSITDLSIKDNASLSECDVKSICRYLENPGEYTVIQENGSGCDSIPEVKDQCTLGVGDSPGYAEKINSLIIYPNPGHDIFNFNIKSIDRQTASLKIFDPRGVMISNIQHFDIPSGQSTFSYDASSLNPGVYIYSLMINNDVITGLLTVTE